jgi:hypothetical protein
VDVFAVEAELAAESDLPQADRLGGGRIQLSLGDDPNPNRARPRRVIHRLVLAGRRLFGRATDGHLDKGGRLFRTAAFRIE